MTKVRCNCIHCDSNDEGLCTRGSIALYNGGECESMRITHYYDDDYGDDD